MFKKEIKVNQDLTSIFNFIESNEYKIKFMELIQYCIDYDLYSQLYIHLPIIMRLLDDHNNREDLKVKES